MPRVVGTLDVPETSSGTGNPASGSSRFWTDPTGTANKLFLRTAAGVLVPAGFGNPMTAANDVIIGGTSGAPTRLAKGSNLTALGVNGSGNLAYLTAAELGGMVKIAELSGTGASGVLEFSSIPATYRTLQLEFFGRSDAAGSGGSGVRMTTEVTPTAGIYNQVTLLTSATTVSATENYGTTDFIFMGFVPTTDGTANLYGAGEMWIPEYARNGPFKNVFMVGAGFTNIATPGINVRNFTGTIEQTAPIDRIRLTLASGNWTTASRATLWGLPA